MKQGAQAGLPWRLSVSEPPSQEPAAGVAATTMPWGARKHEWNVNFEWDAPKPPFRRLTGEQVKSWNDNGFLLIENALSPPDLQRLIDEIDPLEAQAEAYLREHLGGKAFIARAGEITFTNHLAAKSPTVRELVLGDVVLDLCHDLVGPDCRMYWDMSVYKKPGVTKPFPWHQDNGYTFVEPQQYVTFWFSLTDATPSNGCPWVMPGWHLQGTLAHRLTPLGFQCFEQEPAGAVAVPAKAGSIVVFSSLAPHTTLANLTEHTRKSYILEVAPEGAYTVRRDQAGSLHRTPCNNPRQFQILRGGEWAVA